MKNEFIRKKKCKGCGAPITAHLVFCPYCKTEQPDHDLLPSDIYGTLNKQFEKIHKKLIKIWMSPWPAIISWIASLIVLVFPLILSIGLIFIFNNWILAGIFLISGSIVTSIRIYTGYCYYTYSNFSEKKYWQFIIKPKLEQYLRKQNLPESVYYEVILDYLEDQAYPEQSNLSITLDTLDEK